LIAQNDQTTSLVTTNDCTDTRETGFVHAITAAGVTHGISRACSLGTLLDCSCHLISKSSNSILGSDHDWRGCSDNIEFGYQKSKEFMGIGLKKKFDIQSLVLRHNYEAGRLVSQPSAQLIKGSFLYFTSNLALFLNSLI